MVWSYSRLSMFEQCKYSFYLKYIVDDPNEYLAEGNFWAELGSFVHSILEKLYKGELTEEEAPAYFAEHFDEAVLYDAPKKIMDSSYIACANYFADLSLSWLKDFEILGVEYEFNIEIEGYRFKGFIDLLLKDKNTGDIILMDHKSAASPMGKSGKILKSQEKCFSSYCKQMYLYCNAVKQCFGQFPSLIVWNHFKAGQIVDKEFVQSEYERSMRWFIDTIHAIENEEEFSETVDYFYCKNLCDFRNSCEYKMYSREE